MMAVELRNARPLTPLGVGLLWVGLDRRNQGWHDEMANTVVIRLAGKEFGNSEGRRAMSPVLSRGPFDRLGVGACDGIEPRPVACSAGDILGGFLRLFFRHPGSNRRHSKN